MSQNASFSTNLIVRRDLDSVHAERLESSANSAFKSRIFRHRKGVMHPKKYGEFPMHCSLQKIAESDRQNALADELLLTEKKLAERRGISVRTLQNNRVYGTEIPYIKINSSVSYRLSDVVAHETISLCTSPWGV